MSDLPDVYVECQTDGFLVIANKKGRKILNARSKPPRHGRRSGVASY
jgi:hypothetical protein